MLTLRDSVFIVSFTDQNIGCHGARQQTVDDFVPTRIESLVGKYVIIYPLVIPPSQEIWLEELQAALHACERWNTEICSSLRKEGQAGEVAGETRWDE
jgi:hypothetical protein